MHSKVSFDPKQTFFVLDFDRTIANTDKFHEILEETIGEKTTISVDFLHHARFQAEAAGLSFDTIQYLRDYLKDTESDLSWPDIQRSFIAKAQSEDMLEPGARALLAALEKSSIRYGIMTYGGEAWQLAKIEAANLSGVPRLVTRLQQKGIILTEWKQSTGDFLIPPLLTKEFEPVLVRTIVFLDDKAVSFKDIPEGVIGIRIRPPEGIKLEAQKGTVPDGVIEVDGIPGALQVLFEVDKS